MKTIRVLQAFTEVRSGRQYQPGELVTDPAWLAGTDRKAEACAARGLVAIEEQPAKPIVGEDLGALIMGSAGPELFVPTDSGVIPPKGDE